MKPNQKRLTTIELYKENMKFSAAHFTIFSATEREHLHGHNYTVHVAITNWVNENGLTFDYRFYKEKIFLLCRQLNQTLLLPTESKYLAISQDNEYCHAVFNHKKLIFLNTDVTLLPVCNITVEELSAWFVTQLAQDQENLQKHAIEAILVKIFSGPGQGGSCLWERKK